MKKKIVSLFLSLFITCSFSLPVFAQSINPELPVAQLNAIIIEDIPNMTLEELQQAAVMAETDEEAIAVYEELIKYYPADQAVTAQASSIAPTSSSSVVNQYLSVTSATISGSTMTVKYTIKAKVPSNVLLRLGYEYPAATRVSGADTLLAGKDKGSYTATLTMKSLIGNWRVYGRIIAGGYTYTSVYKTGFMAPSGRKTDYRTITKADFAGYYTVYVVVPGVLALLYPQSKLVKFTAAATSVAGHIFAIGEGFNLNVGPPTPAAGQYYKTETWYASGKLNVTLSVWQSKAAFDRGDLPLYSGTVGHSFPAF